jgi:hypothetical protein
MLQLRLLMCHVISGIRHGCYGVNTRQRSVNIKSIQFQPGAIRE